MQVIKRGGKREEVSFDKITARVRKLCYGLDPRYVDPIEICKKVIQGLYDGVTTSELDNLAAETAASMAAIHPDYANLAARIAISNLHKNTDKSFSRTMRELYQYIDPKIGDRANLISDDMNRIIQKNKDIIDSAIIYDRDYSFDYFGFKTLERSYLLRMNGQVVERPQHLLHAGGRRYPRRRHRRGDRDLQPDVGALVYPRHANPVQCRHTQTAVRPVASCCL
jgi:hypothetical protein